MIVAPTWIWLHVPKCAGSAAERVLFSVYGADRDVRFDAIDPKKPVIWHHSIAQRQASDPTFDPGARRVVANIRRLPEWILSRVHFEVQRSGPMSGVTRNELVRGQFRNRAKPGVKVRPKLVQADDVLNGFLPEVTNWVRSEELLTDLSKAIGFDATPYGEQDLRVNVGRIAYVRDLTFWFNRGDLSRLYAANPVWAALESKVYGNLVSLR